MRVAHDPLLAHTMSYNAITRCCSTCPTAKPPKECETSSCKLTFAEQNAAVLTVAASKIQRLSLPKGGTAKSPTVGIGLPYLKRSTVYNSLCPTNILAKK